MSRQHSQSASDALEHSTDAVVAPETIVDELDRLDVELWADDGQLRFRAPKGVLSDQHKAQLRANKAELLAFLDKNDNPTVVADPDRHDEPFPLTDVQAAYLIGRQDSFGFGGVACHGYLEIHWPRLDPARLEAAWNALIERHAMLRAVIEQSGYQRVLSEVSHYTIPCTDLRQATTEAVTEELEAVRRDMENRMHDTPTWPLFELRVTRTPTDDIVHFSLDSLIADWSSAGILLDELDQLMSDPTPKFPALDIAFRDYVLAERGLRDSMNYRRHRRYWLDRIDTLPAAPSLPTAPGSAHLASTFERHRTRLSKPAWDALSRWATANRVTPTVAVLTAYACVIRRWCGQSRFCLNLTLLNRLALHEQVDRLVGDFTSVSLLSVELDATRAIADQAHGIAEQLFADLDHRWFSGVEVVREIARRHGRKAALMPVVFTSAIGLGSSDAPASGRRSGYGVTQTPQVLLDCQVYDDSDGLSVCWDVREQAFPDRMIADMFAAFEALLGRLADDADAWTAPPGIALPAWQRQQRDEVNATAAVLPERLLHADIVDQAARRPHEIAVIDRAGQFSYRWLIEQAHGMARALTQGGLKPGEHVAVATQKSAAQIVAVLGVLLAGGVYVPIDAQQPLRRRQRMLAQSAIRLAIVDATTDSQDWPDALQRLRVENMAPLTLPPSVEDNTRDPDRPAYVIYTSGSSGEPKGVTISHRAALNTIDDINRRFAISADDRGLGLANLGFDLSVYDLFGLLGAGATLVLADPDRGADPSHWLQCLVEYRITVWNSVPAQMQMLADYLDSDPQPLNALRLALLSGDWIGLNLPAQIQRHAPDLSVVALGGATEAAIWSNYHRIERVEPHWRSIPYGRPLANQGFRVLDAEMQDLPTWVAGDLYIAGAGLALGYIADEALTAERFIRHPEDGTRLYRTGDMGRYLPNGELEFLGRRDGQIKIRGHRIELGEIESALASCPGVSAAAAVVATEAGTEHTLLGFVEPARRAKPDTADHGVPPDLDTVLAFAERRTGRHEDGRYAAYSQALRQAAHASMAAVLRARGAALDHEWLDTDTILARARVHERHRWLVRLWLESLHEGGWLELDEQNRYRACADIDDDTQNDAWQLLNEKADSAGIAPALVGYIRAHADQLEALLDDRANPFELLFPRGDDALALSVYADEPAEYYNNHALAAFVHQIATRHDQDRPLRILEIGAGTGATTNVVAPLLDGFDVDYLFTDLSSMFLASARQRLVDFPFVRFATLDIDADPREQGLIPGRFDVVIGAGVLASTQNPNIALDHINSLLAPGGWLLFTEPTADLAHVLLSQGFMMTPPGEDRERGASPLRSSEFWQSAVRDSGGEPVAVLPAPDHPLAAGQIRLFLARYKTDRVGLSLDVVERHLAERLPPPMRPSQIQLIDRLPLTANGKIDRKMLASWRVNMPATAASVAHDSGESDPLEQQLCDIWADALGIAALGRTDNVYDHGADSLIMARVAGRVREQIPDAAEHPYDAVLRQMLNQPNVAALAELIRREQPSNAANPAGQPAPSIPKMREQTNSNALLVPYGGGDGSTTRVMFHAALGTLDYLHHLGRALAAQQLGPVIGIAVAETEPYLGIEPNRLIDTVADDYAQRLIDEGHTRFQLVGYCLGGLLATEVARRLGERGLEIVDLTLVDSIPMFIETDEELAFEAIFVPNLNLDPVHAVFGRELEHDDVYRAIEGLMQAHEQRVPAGALAELDGDAGLAKVAAAVRRQSARPQAERLAAYAEQAAAQAGLPVQPEMIPGLFQLCRHSMRAARFDPPPYVGDMTFLRCTEQQSFGVVGGVGELAAPFWENTCIGQFDLIDVPGNHFSVIEPPNVSVIADHLAGALEKNA